MKKISIRGPLFLLLAALFWGTTFVAQDLASDSVGAFTFNGMRMILGGTVLLPVILVRGKGKLFRSVPTAKQKKKLLFSGMICGTILFCAANFQQFGIQMGTSAGKSGFITAMYVIIVPLLGIFMGKRVRKEIWACVICAAVGMYFLCMASFETTFGEMLRSLAMTKGDLLTLVCALCFAFHIIAVDHFAPGIDGVFLSCVQFLFAGILGVFAMFLFEQPTWSDILAAGGVILYSAVLSCGIAYTLQILGQKETPPVIASILMCLEAVFALFSDMIILKTGMTTEEVCGTVFLFIAILVSNLSEFFPEKKKR